MPVTTRSRSRMAPAMTSSINDLSSISDKSSSSGERAKTKNKTSDKKTVAELTKEECEKWADSLDIINNKKVSKNPLTHFKTNIKYEADLHNKIKDKCLEYGIKFSNKEEDFKSFLEEADDVSIFKEWTKNPTLNPMSGKNDIIISLIENTPYVLIYIRVYKLLRMKGVFHNIIVDSLPKDHLIYGYNHITEYYINLDDNNGNLDSINILSKTFNNMININKKSNRNFNSLKEVYHRYVCIKLDDYFATEIYRFINIINLLTTNKTIEECLQAEKMDYLEKIKINLDIILKYYNDSKYSLYINKNADIKIQIYPYKISFDTGYNIVNAVLKLLSYNDSVVGNKYNIVISKMQDPLLELLDKPEFKDIDKDNLELPKQNFTDSKYAKIMNEYNTKLDSYNTSKSLQTDNITPPKRPTMMVGNTKVTVGVITTLPRQNYKDSVYKKIKDAYDKNKPIINAYKELLNTGFLNLVNKTSISATDTLINKTREDIYEHHLSDDVDRKKCNSNTDIISQDNFDDPLYPLAKLQLMVKLHTRDNNNEIIRTDCFYAPNIYNQLVSLAQQNMAFINPLTRKKLTDENIEEIMRVINIIDPTLVVPYYTREIYDKEFVIDYIEEDNYYKIYIYRAFGDIKITFGFICCILKNVEPADTGSADITSTTFLFKIFDLFNKGLLMNSYMPPYKQNGYFRLPIQFSHYNDVSKWEYHTNSGQQKTRDEKIEMFKHYYDQLLTAASAM